MSSIDVRIRPEIREYHSELIAIRRDLHAHPELAFEEVRTSGIVENYLKDLGLAPRRIARTGVIADVEGTGAGDSSSVIALRADMDALPIHEVPDRDYRSQCDGKMHACGHDAHTAILLVAAKYLVRNRHLFAGRIRFIFQPGEEAVGGAREMIRGGALENPAVEAIFGLHVWGPYQIGTIGISGGPAMACADYFTVKIEGKAGHGAGPHLAVDSVLLGSQFVGAVQAIVSRMVTPLEPVVISIGSFQAGVAPHVIAGEAVLKGTVRTMTPESRRFVVEKLESVLEGVCKPAGAKYEFNYEWGYPCVVNDRRLAGIVREVAEEVFTGAGAILPQRTTGGEDFSFYMEKIPGCFFFIGASNVEEGKTFLHHHPGFDIDERSLLYGLEMMIQIPVRYFK